METPCQTPGAIYSSEILPWRVSCTVDLPKELDLTEQEAALLENNMHNAMEMVLARYFINK